MVSINKKQLRKFILMKQGLFGPYKYAGKTGIMEFIKQAGCIQFDPIDICGKNHELVLQSRVDGFEKNQVFELLYKERSLFDYFDKVMSIIPMDDWRYFNLARNHYVNNGRGKEEINKFAPLIIEHISKNGPIFAIRSEHRKSSDLRPQKGLLQLLMTQIFPSGQTLPKPA